MSMFGDIAHGDDTDNIGKYLLDKLKENPEDKENIKRLILPLYDKFVNWDEGCRNRDLEKEIRESLK